MDKSAAQPKPCRRWYQFGLRTLLIGVALLGLLCAYVGWQAAIVRERKAAVAEIQTLGGDLFPLDLYARLATKYSFPHPDYPSEVSLVRRWLGDRAVMNIWLPDRTGEPEIKRIKAIFPEASMFVGGDRGAMFPAAYRPNR